MFGGPGVVDESLPTMPGASSTLFAWPDQARAKHRAPPLNSSNWTLNAYRSSRSQEENRPPGSALILVRGCFPVPQRAKVSSLNKAGEPRKIGVSRESDGHTV